MGDRADQPPMTPFMLASIVLRRPAPPGRAVGPSGEELKKFHVRDTATLTANPAISTRVL